jgi:hypothetical protein
MMTPLMILTAFQQKILHIMLGLAPWYGDRHDTPLQRHVLLAPIAAEVALAVTEKSDGLSPELKAAVVLSVGYHESKWARYIIEGRCEEGPPGARCDNGSARGPFQQHLEACPLAYKYPEASRESLHEEARCAVQLMTSAFRRCGGWRKAFGSYCSGSCANLELVTSRVQTMWWLHSKLLRYIKLNELEQNNVNQETN